MRIFFLNPPFKPEHGKFSREQRSPAITKSGTLYYPMWLAYGTVVAQAAGHEVFLLDAPAKRLSFEAAERKVLDFKPDILVVDTSTPSIASDVRVAEALRAATGAFTVLVGPHATVTARELVAAHAGIDAVARREYEETVEELARVLGAAGRGGVAQVAGLTWRDAAGGVVENPERVPARALDDIPFVSRAYKEFLDIRDYFYAHSQHPIVTLVTQRGCPYHCVFCVYPQTFGGFKLRQRSVKNVVDEMQWCLENFPGLKEFMFEDDTLTVDGKRAVAFAQEILARGLKIEWTANSRADVSLDTMQWLKKAGARLFCVGIENGDQQMLDQMKKMLDLDRVRRFFQDAKAAGILIHGCFMVGNPGETRATLEKTLAFAKELNPDTAQFFPLMVYPGTEAYNWARENDYLVSDNFADWVTAEGLHNSVVNRPELPARELVEFCDRARREFYLRPSYIAAKAWQAIGHPGEMKRLVKGGVSLARHLVLGTDKPA
jgi:radical SAM superfamily enzyme YgiQ (UPF0313 family)